MREKRSLSLQDENSNFQVRLLCLKNRDNSKLQLETVTNYRKEGKIILKCTWNILTLNIFQVSSRMLPIVVLQNFRKMIFVRMFSHRSNLEM